MKILFLGGNLAKNLSGWLKEQGETVVYREDKITIEELKQIIPDIVITYNYKFIIPKEIIEFMKGNIINLHISFLPWNRGAHPNVWSFLENTPKGVSIHYVDEGIDTGDIIVQKEVYIDEEKETLKTSYEKLHKEIQELFKNNWENIKRKKIIPKKQLERGSIHYKKDCRFFESFINEKGWDISIREFKKKFKTWNCFYKVNLSSK